MTNKRKAKQPASRAASTVEIGGEPGQSVERRIAGAVAEGTLGNAMTVRTFAHGSFGELHATECLDALRDSVKAVQSGDLTGAEAMLTAQAAALNAIFGEMARRSALNMGEYLDAAERYMRLALKAQGQCRATLETLAAIKNPPVVFARQANIAHGPQQVNNAAPSVAQHAEGVGGSKTPDPPALETSPSLTRRIFSPGVSKIKSANDRRAASGGDPG